MQQAIDILDRLEDKVRKQQAMTNYTEWVQNWAIHYLREARKEIQALWDGWIPVTERKPKKMQEVDFSDWKNVWLWYYDGFTNSVTHWRERPLPPTPKQ